MTAGLPWWLFAVAAGVVALAELHAPGSYLVWIALGAAITACATAGTELALAPQLGVFALAAGTSCVLGWFVYRRQGRSPPDTLNSRAQNLVGARAYVLHGLVNGEGKVRLGDSTWLAEGPPLPAGAPVIVTAVRGSRLVVRAD